MIKYEIEGGHLPVVICYPLILCIHCFDSFNQFFALSVDCCPCCKGFLVATLGFSIGHHVQNRLNIIFICRGNILGGQAVDLGSIRLNHQLAGDIANLIISGNIRAVSGNHRPTGSDGAISGNISSAGSQAHNCVVTL